MLLLTLTLDSATASELFSVRCEAGMPARPYFATFDIDAKTVVLESPPASMATPNGINMFVGEINSVGNGIDGRIDFTLRVDPGKLNLILDCSRRRMIWPGLTGDSTFRPTLTHSCSVIAPRSILSFRVFDPVLHPISVQCDEGGYMYFTMDVESKTALFERGGRGRLYQGKVTEVRGDDIVLLMNFDTPRQVLWNRSHQTITIEGIDGDRERPRTVMQCEEIAPRTMIEYHKILR